MLHALPGTFMCPVHTMCNINYLRECFSVSWFGLVMTVHPLCPRGVIDSLYHGHERPTYLVALTPLAFNHPHSLNFVLYNMKNLSKESWIQMALDYYKRNQSKSLQEAASVWYANEDSSTDPFSVIVIYTHSSISTGPGSWMWNSPNIVYFEEIHEEGEVGFVDPFDKLLSSYIRRTESTLWPKFVIYPTAFCLSKNHFLQSY